MNVLTNSEAPNTILQYYNIRSGNGVSLMSRWLAETACWLIECQNMGEASLMGLVATKPVFGVSDKVRFKPACSATETS